MPSAMPQISDGHIFWQEVPIQNVEQAIGLAHEIIRSKYVSCRLLTITPLIVEKVWRIFSHVSPFLTIQSSYVVSW